MAVNKHKLMAAIAVAALIAGSNAAFGQRMEGGGGASVQGGGGASAQGGGTVGAGGSMSERGSNARGAQGPERRSMTPSRRGSNTRPEQGSIRGQGTVGRGDLNRRSDRSSRQITRERTNDRSIRTEGRGERSLGTEQRGERSFRNGERGDRSFRSGERERSFRNERPSTVGRGGGRVNADVGVNLSDRDRTRIRDVIVRRDIPRVRNIDFDLRVGTVIPRRVRLVAVPEEVVRIHPRFRRDRFFIANDEIVIVDPVTLRIIAVLPA